MIADHLYKVSSPSRYIKDYFAQLILIRYIKHIVNFIFIESVFFYSILIEECFEMSSCVQSVADPTKKSHKTRYNLII